MVRNKSFTLIELLVVIAIIGLLASIVLVSMGGIQSKARITKTLEFSQSIQRGLGAYAVGIWSFDDQTNPTKDGSGYNNHGTVNGATFSSDTPHAAIDRGTGRYSLSFNGNGYAQAPLITTQTDNWTIMVWAKSNTTSGVGGVVQVGGPQCVGFSITRSGGNWYPLYPCRAWNPSITPVVVGAWIHLVVVRENGIMKAYANGVQTVNGVTVTPLSPSGNYTEIGAAERLSGGNYLFNGLIDEVQIYETALTLGEVRKLYAEGLKRHKDLAIK